MLPSCSQLYLKSLIEQSFISLALPASSSSLLDFALTPRPESSLHSYLPQSLQSGCILACAAPKLFATGWFDELVA